MELLRGSFACYQLVHVLQITSVSSRCEDLVFKGPGDCRSVNVKVDHSMLFEQQVPLIVAYYIYQKLEKEAGKNIGTYTV